MKSTDRKKGPIATAANRIANAQALGQGRLVYSGQFGKIITDLREAPPLDRSPQETARDEPADLADDGTPF